MLTIFLSDDLLNNFKKKNIWKPIFGLWISEIRFFRNRYRKSRSPVLGFWKNPTFDKRIFSFLNSNSQSGFSICKSEYLKSIVQAPCITSTMSRSLNTGSLEPQFWYVNILRHRLKTFAVGFGYFKITLSNYPRPVNCTNNCMTIRGQLFS